jgi:hypothetical protein
MVNHIVSSRLDSAISGSKLLKKHGYFLQWDDMPATVYYFHERFLVFSVLLAI